MKTKLVKIGNSKGVRIPKAFIKKAGINGSVNIELGDGCIILRGSEPRAGWDEAMRKAVKKHGNDLTQEDLDWMSFPNEFDKKEPPW